MGGVDSGRRAQMEAIVAEHETALLRYATRILSNPVAAQDVVQNVFIKLFQGWQPGTRPSDKLKSWLFRVTHNEAIDHVRHESRLSLLHEKQAEETQANACPDGRHCPMGEDDRKVMVLQYLRKLKAEEQQVVLLRLEEGLSYAEISAVTGRSEGNVGNILHHAVKKLSNELEKAGIIRAVGATA
jgi:RNA polymerase sigma-70 factor (ECF subfamily)